MLAALLHGKISSEMEGSEDFLTSCVFGVLEDHPAQLMKFLSKAVLADGSTPITLEPADGWELTSCEYWPLWKSPELIPTEPDVILRFEAKSGEKRVICVEAKFRSGKSGTSAASQGAPRDQLAREWDHLLREAAGATPQFVYLTAGIAFPRKEVEEAIQEYRGLRPGKLDPPIAWLSWRMLPDLFSNSSVRRIRELAALADRFGLRYFAGIRPLDQLPEIEWKFFGRGWNWNSVQLDEIGWRFSK